MATQNEEIYKIDPGLLPQDAEVIIVHTLWNAPIVDRLTDGCKKVLGQFAQVRFKTIAVPGAFEIPFAVKQYWEACSERFDKPKAFIALGCVLRGGTPHFEYVSKAVTDGILQLNLMLPVPVIFGVLTLDNQQQADERTGGIYGNKGEEAAWSALHMISRKDGVAG